MSIVEGVEFEENDAFDYDKKSEPIEFVDSSINNNLPKRHKNLSMTEWLIDNGLAKTHRRAQWILVCIIIVNIIITIIAFIIQSI